MTQQDQKELLSGGDDVRRLLTATNMFTFSPFY